MAMPDATIKWEQEQDHEEDVFWLPVIPAGSDMVGKRDEDDNNGVLGSSGCPLVEAGASRSVGCTLCGTRSEWASLSGDAPGVSLNSGD